MYASCGFLANTFLTYAARKVRNVSKVTRGKALAAALLWAPSLSQKEDRLQPQEPKPMPAACLQRGQAVVGQPREQMQASAATGKHGPVKLLAAMPDLPTRWTGWCARSRVLSARFPIGARLAIYIQSPAFEYRGALLHAPAGQARRAPKETMQWGRTRGHDRIPCF